MSSVITLGDVSQPVNPVHNQRLRSEPEQHRVHVSPDYRASCMWVSFSDCAPGYFTNEVLSDLRQICRGIRGLETAPFRYRVLKSNHASIFSLGGDLRLFRDCIEQQRVEVLEKYARSAVSAIWESISGSGYPDLTSVALVEGEAQGGGVEAALASHILVAEEQARFGFPESLFGLFPGMGAKELLSARASRNVASTLISSAKRYSATELHQLGVIDYVVPAGQGLRFVRDAILNMPLETNLRHRARFDAISLDQLFRSVDQWVEAAMKLGRRSRRAMNYLIEAQERMFSKLDLSQAGGKNAGLPQ